MQALLVGGLSALGRAGALLNQPIEEFSNAIRSNSFSSNTIRRSPKPSLLPALIDGFFNLRGFSGFRLLWAILDSNQ
ncbi:hypothetical protein BST81_25845 [Leptolyngbya sp. 'hensonii']|uniref:hypothetical protein n=1 Tax=Leptolyngbya sp. 'hensonii' TaxID=1922337 RepID=UPI00094F6439|nr:hypothetical protein [Leptolyngbya sp. 'hensonii']OLP15527.1 hypothetical protein BST81_25845 [Leptolyngbya sp. 'hensonii']